MNAGLTLSENQRAIRTISNARSRDLVTDKALRPHSTACMIRTQTLTRQKTPYGYEKTHMLGSNPETRCVRDGVVSKGSGWRESSGSPRTPPSAKTFVPLRQHRQRFLLRKSELPHQVGQSLFQGRDYGLYPVGRDAHWPEGPYAIFSEAVLSLCLRRPGPCTEYTELLRDRWRKRPALNGEDPSRFREVLGPWVIADDYACSALNESVE